MYRAIDNLDKLIAGSHEKPVLILKHSKTCPISAWGKSRVDSFLKKHDELEAYLVVVQEERGLSNEIAQALGIPHETPQALVVRDGKAVEALSHYRVTKSNLSRAFGLD
jgi:monothiol bacilliredoxin